MSLHKYHSFEKQSSIYDSTADFFYLKLAISLVKTVHSKYTENALCVYRNIHFQCTELFSFAYVDDLDYSDDNKDIPSSKNDGDNKELTTLGMYRNKTL